MRQVYIPLRAYYVEQTQTKNEELKQPKKNEELKQPKRMVCDLHQEIENWLRHFDKDDAIRVISGGPGCGKSTFSKILAADLAEADEIPVLFIPLHHFSISEDLHQAIAAYVQQDPFLRVNPLDAKEGERRLLVIFDGLDELSMQGKAADMVARDFVDEVIQTLYKRNNYANTQWQVLITGRDLAVQANETRLRKPKQILHFLPYFLPHTDLDFEPFIDIKKILDNNKNKLENHEKNLEGILNAINLNLGRLNVDTHTQRLLVLLTIDQRQQWWEKFSKAKGLGIKGLPTELCTKHLEPITSEPLLNYLVALSYERKKVEFNSNTRLNTIYYDLLLAVYERQYAGFRHQSAKELHFDEFLQVLEEIALAVWHGNGRTATESYLVERCKESNLTTYLERYAEDAKKGVVRLLTGFYFRQFSMENNGDRTFEFTHKSFGEYLTARRIIGAVETIVDEITRHQQAPRKGWNTEKALLEWIKICGKTEIDNYVERFIKEEIAQKAEANLEQIKVWQRVFLDLVVYVVHNASPMEKLSGLTFQEMLEQSKNAERAIMLIHKLCAQQTHTILDVTWLTDSSFQKWQTRTHCKNLSYLNLNYQNLREINLRDVDLTGASIVGVDLKGVNLALAYTQGIKR